MTDELPYIVFKGKDEMYYIVYKGIELHATRNRYEANMFRAELILKMTDKNNDDQEQDNE